MSINNNPDSSRSGLRFVPVAARPVGQCLFEIDNVGCQFPPPNELQDHGMTRAEPLHGAIEVPGVLEVIERGTVPGNFLLYCHGTPPFGTLGHWFAQQRFVLPVEILDLWTDYTPRDAFRECRLSQAAIIGMAR